MLIISRTLLNVHHQEYFFTYIFSLGSELVVNLLCDPSWHSACYGVGWLTRLFECAELDYTWFYSNNFQEENFYCEVFFIEKFTKVFLGQCGWEIYKTVSDQCGGLVRSRNGFSPVTCWKPTLQPRVTVTNHQRCGKNTGQVGKGQWITAESLTLERLELKFHFSSLFTPWPW